MTVAPTVAPSLGLTFDFDSLLGLVVAGPTADRMPAVSPLTLETLAEVPVSSDDDIRHAFTEARAAQREWQQWSPRERAAVVLRFHDVLLDHRTDALDLIQAETGKARSDASEEFIDVLLNARHYGRVGPRLLKPERHRGLVPLLTQTLEVKHPKGVVGVVAPWNYPLTMAISDALPALIAGNAIVLKPDSQTTLTALYAVSLLYEAGLPRGVMRVVVGPGTRVGPVLVANSDYVMLTGSTAVGRQVAAQCGERLISCSMELGGKNAMLVLADADVDRSAEIAINACFSNAGQLCISIERMFVAQEVYDEFLAAFVARAKALKLKAGIGWGADTGSLISQKQLRTVVEHVDDAVSKGAVVLAGGRARPDVGPYFYEPTVLAGVTADMTVCDNETFGPVVSVYSFASVDEAIDRANDTEYGLNASIFTRDARAAREVAARLKAGTVNINEGYGAAFGTTAAPMGGMGASGIGRRHGREGLLKYTESQTIATQRLLHFGPQFGFSDEQWSQLMTKGFAVMKKMGLS